MVRGEAVDEAGQDSAEARALRSLHETRVRAELREADRLVPGADAVAWSGSLLAEVALVKGRPGPAETAGDAALSGADGEAADLALAALGWPPDSAFRLLSAPLGSDDSAARAHRVRLAIEATDPRVVVALDAVAAEDVAAAFGLERLGFGVRVLAHGRHLVAVDGLEASLADAERKKRVWHQLRAAAPEAPVY